MATKRKTAAERRQQQAAEDNRAWRDFHAKLEAAKCVFDVKVLLANIVATYDPGRRFYSNLIYFWEYLGTPDDAESRELAAYCGLLSRLEASGEIASEKVREVRAELREAIRDRGTPN